MVNPAVPVNAGNGAQPDPKDNDNGCGQKIHLQGNGKIAPERFSYRLGRNERPTQIAFKYFFDPAKVLDVKRIIQTELLDQFGDVLGLLGAGYKGCRPAFRTEGHQDAEYQNGNPEKNNNQ
jgi:hypothetical protein